MFVNASVKTLSCFRKSWFLMTEMIGICLSGTSFLFTLSVVRLWRPGMMIIVVIIVVIIMMIIMVISLNNITIITIKSYKTILFLLTAAKTTRPKKISVLNILEMCFYRTTLRTVLDLVQRIEFICFQLAIIRFFFLLTSKMYQRL